MTITPIAIFAFKRPAHTSRMLESLSQNHGISDHPIYIYCDGARHAGETEAVNAVRSLVDNFHHPNKTVIKRTTNWGLARSVIDGVTGICKEYEQVIVLEDDLVLSPEFLSFMRQALTQYADVSRVMQVSGHAFPVDAFSGQSTALLLPFIGSWGWATWSRAWQQFDPEAKGWSELFNDPAMRRRFDIDNAYSYTNMLFQQMLGRIDSWAIRWNWSVFKAEGLAVYPANSLVNNIGFDGSGTHCGTGVLVNSDALSKVSHFIFPQRIEVDPQQFLQVRHAIIQSQGAWWRRVAVSLRNHCQRWVFRRVAIKAK